MKYQLKLASELELQCDSLSTCSEGFIFKTILKKCKKRKLPITLIFPSKCTYDFYANILTSDNVMVLAKDIV